jgi:hypothetical protein
MKYATVFFFFLMNEICYYYMHLCKLTYMEDTLNVVEI